MILDDIQLFQKLLERSPFSARELTVLIETAPARYKDHYIQKRHGRGMRLISQPSSEIKFLQRLIVAYELCDVPIHDAAIAYQTGRSIKDHALPHANGRYLLKLDFKDFFPSLRADTLKYRLGRDKNFSDIELWILCQLLCRRNRKTGKLELSIGAPSSPFISNYLLWEFDSLLTSFCSKLDVRYTRYADDLAFSTSKPKVLDEVQEKVSSLLRDLDYLGVSLNQDKTVNVSKKNQRTLTGLRLSNDGAVSIGRDKKRKLRAIMHAFSQNQLLAEEVNQLRGKLAFVFSVDPEFVTTLLKKYNLKKISDIDLGI